jgi:glucokinase
MTIDSAPDARLCACGQPGHLEAYVSATAVVARANETLAQLPASSLHNVHRSITARDIADAAEAGDAVAAKIIDHTATYLARGIAILAHILDPELYILGGAMNFGGMQTQIGRNFLESVVRQVKTATFPAVAKNLKIVYAQLGSDAGFVGAAGLARRGLLSGSQE